MNAIKEIRPFQPVDQVYTDIILELGTSVRELLIHFFDGHSRVQEVRGPFAGFSRNSSGEEFVMLGDHTQVRIDRIIAVNGKPGPAYEEYDSYALACLDCMGGMD